MTPADAITAYRLDDVPGWMSPPELEWLVTTARDTIGPIVEVGTYKGRSTAAMIAGRVLAGQPASDVIAVDTYDGRGTPDPEHQVDTKRPWVNIASVAEMLGHRGLGWPSFWMRESVAAARIVHQVSWVFIDACHDEADVRADISAWAATLRWRGILSGHDYDPQHPGVCAAVDELLGMVEHPAGSIWTTRL